MRRNAGAVLAAALLIIVFNTRPSIAGFAGAASAPAIVDVEPPVIEFTSPRSGSILYGFTVATLAWTISDAHPANGLHLQTATVIVDGADYESNQQDSSPGLHQWAWAVPNISSGTNLLRVSVRDAFGNQAALDSDTFMILLNDTGVIGSPPASAFLDAPYPNPFNPTTRIVFGLPAAGRAGVSVYDLRGRHLRTLLDERRQAGTWSTTWDGRDDAGDPVPAGSYILRLDLDGRIVQTRKAVLLP